MPIIGSIIKRTIKLRGTLPLESNGRKQPAMIKSIQKNSMRQIWNLSKYDFPKEFYTQGILMPGGSTRQFMSLCGEHLSLDNPNRAIQTVESKQNIHIRDFAGEGIKCSERMFAHHGYIGTEAEIDPIVAAQVVDNNLKLLNDDSRIERLHAFVEVTAQICRPEVFYNRMKKN